MYHEIEDILTTHPNLLMKFWIEMFNFYITVFSINIYKKITQNSPSLKNKKKVAKDE
jgi:hypothetical protein